MQSAKKGTAIPIPCQSSRTQISGPTVPYQLIEDQLARIAQSAVFRRSETVLRLLRCIVERSAVGDGAGLKEYALALDVFGRSADFDPKDFALVRVQANRLRNKLAEYYATCPNDPVVISIPKGAYTATFTRGSRLESLQDVLADLERSDDDIAGMSPDRCYQRALRLFQRWTPRNLLRCCACCRRAAQLSPGSGQFEGLLALSLASLYWFDVLPPPDIVAKCRKSAEKALSVEPQNGPALAALAYLAWAYDCDEAEAAIYLGRLERAGTGEAFGAYLSALVSTCDGKFSEAARALAGTHHGIMQHNPEITAAASLMLNGSFEAAIERLRSVVPNDDTFAFAHWLLGSAYLALDRPLEAVGPFARAAKLEDIGTLYVSSLGYAYGVTGRTEEAKGILQKLLRLSQEQYVCKVDLAKVYVGLGDITAGRRYLCIADEERSGRLATISLAPELCRWAAAALAFGSDIPA